MPWPTPLEYRESVANPKYGFSHTVLLNCKPVLDKLGLPQSSNGNYACVFKMQCGSNFWAVRCFSNPVTDQKERYTKLSQHLQTFSSSYLVKFEYVEQGIRVNGEWFPIVMMKWADGEAMDNYIKPRVKDPEALRALAANWRGLVASLRGALMAHGDLQHGNVLIGNTGQMYLVDYDGMYISNMKGNAPELGHINYQHPGRTRSFFNVDIDNFSSLAIYISLLALVADPGLWDFNTGQNLILSRQDYVDAQNGKVSTPFKRLQANADPRVRLLVNNLLEYCKKPVEQVPEMEPIVQGVAHIRIPPPPPPPPGPVEEQPLATKKPKNIQGPAPSRTKPVCLVCDTPYSTDEIFCQNCLTRLDPDLKPCPKCQHLIPKKSLYCGKCGHKQGGAK
jgi:hypothetical protein